MAKRAGRQGEGAMENMNLFLKKTKKFFNQYWHWLVLAGLAIIFFLATASYNFLIQIDDFIKWQSPDETANYIVAKLYAQTGEMTVFEKYNLIVNDVIQPRSFRSDAGVLKPVSFLGLILIYGFLAKLFSYEILPYLTPIFGAVGLIFYYLLVKKIFGRRNAFISVFLLASFPVWLYYTARSMFHNVLFMVLLIIGLYYGLVMVNGRFRKDWPKKILNWGQATLSGFVFGLAVITRTSELLWLIPMLLIIWLFNIKKIGFTKLIIWLSFFALAILPVLSWNKILYGSPVEGGYIEMNQSVVNIASASQELVKSTLSGQLAYHKELFFKIKNNVFYFGFNPKQSTKMLYYYFAHMFFWLFWPALVGFILLLQGARKWKKRHFLYLISYFIVSLILIFYYGSWGFNDNPDPNSFTIGNSYTRYWLPIYLGAMPLVSIFIIKLTRVLVSLRWRSKKKVVIITPGEQASALKWPRQRVLLASSRALLIGLVFFITIPFVLHGSEEGLIYSFYNRTMSRYEYDQVINLTEPSSIIITRYHDKIFFPERKVIVGLFDNNEINLHYAKLIKYVPVYYYNFTLPEKDVKYLNDVQLKEVGLQIELVEKINQTFTLYKLIKINNYER